MRWAEVIGDPVAHSQSPAIHRYWLQALGMEGDYRATRVGAGDVGGFLAGRRVADGWAGCNVTMPLKEAVLPHLDVLNPVAARLGAVNCIVRMADGRLVGHNSDVDGVSGPVAGVGGVPPVVAQVIGAGGAARAAVLALRALGLERIAVYNRTVARAAEAALLADGEAFGLEALRPLGGGCHLIVNATSMGMLGSPPPPVPLALYAPDTLLFDMVYTPRETALLRDARARGFRTIEGLQMLVGQAATAFAHFFGVRVPVREMGEEGVFSVLR